MDYSMDEIKISNKILYYLLKNKELKENEEELYKAYSENENIAELVKVAGEEVECVVKKFGATIYLSLIHISATKSNKPTKPTK